MNSELGAEEREAKNPEPGTRNPHCLGLSLFQLRTENRELKPENRELKTENHALMNIRVRTENHKDESFDIRYKTFCDT